MCNFKVNLSSLLSCCRNYVNNYYHQVFALIFKYTLCADVFKLPFLQSILLQKELIFLAWSAAVVSCKLSTPEMCLKQPHSRDAFHWKALVYIITSSIKTVEEIFIVEIVNLVNLLQYAVILSACTIIAFSRFRHTSFILHVYMQN